MSTISADDVQHIANLARIEITEDKLPEYSNALSNILDLVGQLSAVDTSGITPMAHPQNTPQPQREDVVTEGDFSEHFKDMAPELEANLFLVPQVIE